MKALNDQISSFHQPLKKFFPVRCLDVECDASLAGVQSKPEQALLRVRLVMVKRPDAPRRVATRLLYLYDIGAHVTKDFAA